jgi:hypothetical protein
MLEVIHIGSVVTAAVGACCAVGARGNRSTVVWLPEIVMVAAMLDIIMGVGLVAPMVWAAVLVGLALWVGLDIRMRRNGPLRGKVRHSDSVRGAMAVLRGTGLVVMGLLMLVMAVPLAPTAAAGGTISDGHGAHEISGSLVLQCAVGGAAGVLGLAVWVATRLAVEARRGPQEPQSRFFFRFLAPLEIASMAGSLILMSIAAVV